MSHTFDKFRGSFDLDNLKKKLLFTIGLLIIYRLGSFIPVPNLEPSQLKKLVEGGGTIFGFFDIMTGGSFSMATIFAMSITPYINASIIIQLLAIVIPKLEQLSKEGEEGRRIMGQYIRYLTVVLAFVQATAFYYGLRNSIIGGPSVLSYVTITLTFTAGTAFLMWLGEKITEHGIGNGISLIILAGIISRGPAGVYNIMQYYKAGKLGTGLWGLLGVLGVILIFVGVIAAVVWVQQAERRIPVQYAKRVVGRKMYGGQGTHIPLKLNMAGVIPIIFAAVFVSLPSTIITLFYANSTNPIVMWFKNAQQSIIFALISAILVVFFTFFYTFIQFNPIEVSNNLKKNGGFIPGIRPGKPTSEFISKVTTRITWFGALFLAVIQILPAIIGKLTNINGIWFAGTGVLILVGVALDTVKQIQSQMITKYYKGFLEI